jgi:hypothetical protein
MLDKLKNYEPLFIKIVLDDATREKYADMLVIFKGAKNVEDVIRELRDNFSAEFPEKEVVRRSLDDFEIANIREEYCTIQENELPDAIREQLDAYERAKRLKKEADDNLLTVRKNIADLAARVKDGAEDFRLSSKNTVKLACAGQFFYYSWINERMELVKVEKIPSWDAKSLWSLEERNRLAFKDVLGIDLPETDRPDEPEDLPEEGTEESIGNGDPDDIGEGGESE